MRVRMALAPALFVFGMSVPAGAETVRFVVARPNPIPLPPSNSYVLPLADPTDIAKECARGERWALRWEPDVARAGCPRMDPSDGRDDLLLGLHRRGGDRTVAGAILHVESHPGDVPQPVATRQSPMSVRCRMIWPSTR